MSTNKQYQIYMKYEPGECPSLPAPFEYIDQTYDPSQCPVHPVLVFEPKTRIHVARRRIEELKKVAGIVKIWFYYGEHVKESDCWQKIDGKWEMI